MEAKSQAQKLLSQHHPTIARRTALETSSTFPQGSRGHIFWLEVVAAVEEMTSRIATPPAYLGTALKNQAVNKENNDEE